MRGDGQRAGAMTAISPQVLGIVCVMVAVLIFSVQDMAIKWLSGGYPLHQIVFIRASVAIALTLALFVPLEGGYRILLSRRWKLHLLRGGSIVIGNMAFFTGLASLPLAEAVAIFFTAPLIITILSVPMLGERVGLQRWLAVLVGLCGVIIIVRPGTAAFQAAAILPLVAAFAYSMLQMMTRKLGIAEKAATMSFYMQLMFLSSSCLMWLVAGDGRFAGGGNPSVEFLLRAWVWPSNTDFAIIFAIGLMNACGGYLISQGYRVAEAGLVAPFEYVAMPLAVLWGVLLWGDWPDSVAWIGIVLIGGAGLFVAYREARRGRKIATERPVRRQS